MLKTFGFLMNEKKTFIKIQDDPLSELPSFNVYNKNGLDLKLETIRGKTKFQLILQIDKQEYLSK